MPNYMWLIQTFPDLIVVTGREDLLENSPERGLRSSPDLDPDLG